jgi:hypothetical protein
MRRKTLIPLFAAVALWPLTSATLAQVQPGTGQTTALSSVKVTETSDVPKAVVIAASGKCEYSEDGRTFTTLKATDVVNQGVVVRTGEDARADLFFRRIGTTVRLQSGAEVKLEKMTHSSKAGVSEFHTLLDLRKGRIFTVVRASVPGSTLEIRNAAGRSVVEGAGSGRYIITADGTHVADKKSGIPLKVIGETGITVIAPGQSFAAKEGKMLPAAPPEEVKALIELDELQELTDNLSRPPVAKREPPNK